MPFTHRFLFRFVLATPFILAAVFFGAVLAWNHLFAPLPPPPPGLFAPPNFSFDDYAVIDGAQATMQERLEHQFRTGTPKTLVDNILVAKDGATVTEGEKSRFRKFTYLHKAAAPPFLPASCAGWRVNIAYNAKLELQLIDVVKVSCSPLLQL